MLSQYIIASLFISRCTYLLAWIVITEVPFQIAVHGRDRPRLTLSNFNEAADTIGGLTLNAPLVQSLLALSFFSIAAISLTRWIFRYIHSVVVEKTQIDLEDDRRHVAYAWTCAIIGLSCVLTETLTALEFESEDLLIGIGGVNMLVEEIRILETKHRQKTRPVKP